MINLRPSNCQICGVLIQVLPQEGMRLCPPCWSTLNIGKGIDWDELAEECKRGLYERSILKDAMDR